MISVAASLSIPAKRTGLHRSLESDDGGILFLEQSEAMLVVIVDNASARRKSLISTTYWQILTLQTTLLLCELQSLQSSQMVSLDLRTLAQ